MKTIIRTAILVFSAAPLLASTSYAGRTLRPVLIETAPVALSPATTTIIAPVETTPIATSNPILIGTPVVGPAITPVLVTNPTDSPTPIPPSIIIYPTNPIIFPTNPISLP